jgi:uridylate kinase
MMSADTLILLSDIDGLYTADPKTNPSATFIPEVKEITADIEAMAGDVIFDAKLQKTINVDIRYVLFIIDKYAGAKHIVNEMTIIR